MTNTEALHSLRADLSDRIAVDLMETGAATVYGPQSTKVRVWNAAERAAKTANLNAHTIRDGQVWRVIVLP